MKDWRSSYSKYKEFFLNSYGEYTKKEEIKMFLEVTLSLFASAFFIFFALKPTVLTIGELLKTIQAKEEVIIKMDEKINNIEIAKALYSSAPSRIDLVNFSVPDSPEPDTFSQQVLGLSAFTQTSLSNIAVEQVPVKGRDAGFVEGELDPLPESTSGMPFTLNAEVVGNFSSLTSFISNLKNLRRSIKIDTVTLTSAENEGIQNLILAITGRGAYLGAEEPPKQANPDNADEKIPIP